MGFGRDYLRRVQRLNPIALWPLSEQSGTVAYDRSGNGRNGAYTGVELGQPGIGDGRTCPLFDGTTDYVNVYSASLAAAFNGAEGTLLAWAKVAGAEVWTDGTENDVFSLMADSANWIKCYKATTNGWLVFLYRAGNITSAPQLGGQSHTGWISLALTWSKTADEVKAYLNGTQFDTTKTGLGVWAGTPSAATTCVGAASTVPDNPWSGTLALAALLNRALSPAEVASVGVL